MMADGMHPGGPHGGNAGKLVMMANQIGAFFTSQGPEQKVAGTLSHLQKFWDPRMRAAIIAHLRAGGEGLRPEVRLAVEELSKQAKASVGEKTPA
jgi:formate dehydrogenase subunit delta